MITKEKINKLEKYFGEQVWEDLPPYEYMSARTRFILAFEEWINELNAWDIYNILEDDEDIEDIKKSVNDSVLNYLDFDVKQLCGVRQ